MNSMIVQVKLPFKVVIFYRKTFFNYGETFVRNFHSFMSSNKTLFTKNSLGLNSKISISSFKN